MARVAIALGSNLGDRSAHLSAAIDMLPGVGDLVAVSPVYETAPVGGPDQGDYLNAVALIDTVLEPGVLLERLLDHEQLAGRVRTERWGPRVIDLDIVLWEDRSVNDPGLTVPHPEMAHRRFVLVPLLDVWPDAKLPDGSPVADLVAATSGQKMRIVGGITGPGPMAPPAVVFLVTGVLAVLVWIIIGWLL